MSQPLRRRIRQRWNLNAPLTTAPCGCRWVWPIGPDENQYPSFTCRGHRLF